MRLFESLHQDFRHGVRALSRTRAMAAAIVLSLGFGVGAVTVVYSWEEGLILRPLPAVDRIDRLLTIRPRAPNSTIFISQPEFLDWREQSRTVAGLAAVSLNLFAVAPEYASAGTAPEPIYGMFVSANYFDVLGVRPVIGRTFRPSEDEPGADAMVAVVSQAFWRTRFGGKRAAQSEPRLRVNGRLVTIIGVAPETFGGTMAGAQFDLWLPLESRKTVVPSEAAEALDRSNRWLDVIGRASPGATRAQVQEEFTAIAARLAAQFPDNRGRTIRVEPLDTGSAQLLRPLLGSLIGLTSIVLLIVCFNVANLLFVRGAIRTREIGLRFALGATRGRVVRQLMTENVLLAVAGSGAGVGLAVGGRRLLEGLLPDFTVPINVHTPFDGGVMTFVIGLTGVTVLLFGVLPALMTSRVKVTETLSASSRGSTFGPGRTRAILVVAQFALSLATLVSGALFLRRAEYVRSLELGFSDPGRVLLLQTEAALAGYEDLGRWATTLDRIAEKARNAPGVRSATWATFIPLGYIGYWRREVRVEGYHPAEGESMRILLNGVGPGYFGLMGIPLLEGREIVEDDRLDRPGVAVVNQAFVRRFWNGASPIGRRLTVLGHDWTVVGLAQDGRYDYRSIDAPAEPLIYYALRQNPARFVNLHLRTEGPALSAATAVRQAIRAVDPAMLTLAPLSLEEYISLPMTPAILGSVLLRILGGAALLISGMGLHAVIAYGVAIRTREIGIRLALGATTRQVRRIFLRQSAVLAGAGVLAGLGLALGAGQFIRHQLAPMPALTLAMIGSPVLLLVGVGLIAGYFPARRSSRVDPVSALRAE